MTATKTTKTKPKTKRAATKDVDPGDLKDPLTDSMFENVDIFYNGSAYKPGKKDIQEISFLGTKTIQAKVKPNLSVFWNPLIWDWTKVPDKEAYEIKYKRKCQAIYFKEKVFLVEKSKIKKGIVNDEFVDTAELPIGIVVYWSAEADTWEMLGYKETLLR
tara:strand:+ start:9762 stop:10241 length:480 start_codon:yes stop_codon:yes gene_type:complete